MAKMKAAVDPEMAEFEAALLRSIDQVARGERRTTTPEPMAARKLKLLPVLLC